LSLKSCLYGLVVLRMGHRKLGKGAHPANRQQIVKKDGDAAIFSSEISIENNTYQLRSKVTTKRAVGTLLR
jgi:hypothetical protein